MALLINNVRTSRESLGDFQAQFAANNVGEKRLSEIISKYGPETVTHYMNELIAYSDRQMRARLKDLPAGRFTFEDFLEGDGISDDLINIKATVEIKPEQGITVDFSGTSPQVKGSVNCTRAVTMACVFYALKCVIDPDLPSTGGAFKSVEVITPPGTIVNPRFPAPVSNANINTSQRITDVVLGALAKILPRRVTAASSGSMGLFTIGGMDPGTNQYYSYVETYGGGQGALYNLDGMDGVHTNMTNTRNTPVEVIETSYPLRVEKYGLVTDSDGPGRYRGGMGLTRELTVLGHEPVMNLGSDRLDIAPWGLEGGKPGGTVNSRIESPSGETEALPSKVTREVAEGSRIVLRTAGAGGYGDPFTRDPESVRIDVMEGLISPERAKKYYGVVIDQENRMVDQGATDTLRSTVSKDTRG